MNGKRQNTALHKNRLNSTQRFHAVLSQLFFVLLVDETNRHYQYLYNRLSPVPDVTESEMFLFPAVVTQMGHYI
jgi:hypothetical protein